MIPTTHVQVKKKLKTYSLKHKTYMCVKILDFLVAKFLDKLVEFKRNFSYVFVLLFYWFLKHSFHLPASN